MERQTNDHTDREFIFLGYMEDLDGSASRVLVDISNHDIVLWVFDPAASTGFLSVSKD